MLTLRHVAMWINRHMKGYRATTEQGFACTDRTIPGTRLRHEGLGRTGARIKVYRRGHLVLDHNNAETYRCVEDVLEWLRPECAALGVSFMGLTRGRVAR